MTKNKKIIKISYKDLKHPQADKIWVHFLIFMVMGAFIIWIFATITNLLTPTYRGIIEFNNSNYPLSVEGQRYLKVYEISKYEESRSVLIIEVPYYSMEDQLNLYKGLEAFFNDNPGLINKTVFLCEGLSSNQSINVKSLINVEPNPNEELIKEVLSNFPNFPGYVAYTWKYQHDIPIVGIEENHIYQEYAKLWIKMQDKEDERDIASIWHIAIVARNKHLVHNLIEKSRNRNPILFVNRQYLRMQKSNDFRQVKYGDLKGLTNSIPYDNTEDFSILGIYDFLKQERIGYTFLVSKQFEYPEVQQEMKTTPSVTVTSLIKEVAQFIQTSVKSEIIGENEEEIDKEKGEISNGEKTLETPDGKVFNPEEWEKSPVIYEPAGGKYKEYEGGTITEVEYTHKETGEKIWRRTIRDKNGKVASDHF